jgi:uncharacterized membrane protein YesL
MKGSSGLMDGLYRLSEWIMRFSITNLLWFIFNLPIAFFVINLLYVKQAGAWIFSLVPLIILLPLLFFPATTAMFACARDWVMKEENTSIKQYWHYFKDNYKKSLICGLILTAIWTIWGIDYYYFSRENVILMGIFFIMGIILYVFTINFFSVFSHYELKWQQLLKNAFIITLGSPKLFLTIFITSGIILFMSIKAFPVIIPFFTGSVVAYLSFSAFYRFYLKITKKEG